MPTVVESRIEFTYEAPASFSRFDVGDQNRIWKGVDFIIDEGRDWIWLEVTNYRTGTPRRRPITESGWKALYGEVLLKFLGTTAYLAHRGEFVSKPLTFVLLIELPPLDSGMMATLSNRINQYLRPRGPWKSPVNVAIWNVRQWNEYFDEYPARRV